MKIGIVGSGVIAQSIGKFLYDAEIADFRLAGIHGIETEQTAKLAEGLQVPALSLMELISGSDLVLEAATAAAMPDIVKCTVTAGKSVLTMSVGGFALSPDLLDLLEKHPTNVFVPYGGVAGLDGLLALREIGLDRVELTTTKSLHSLRGAPFFSCGSPYSNLDEIVEPTAIFIGSAREAIAAFPANANLAITLSLAGLGFDRTLVKIIADPNTERTIQHVEAVAGECVLQATVQGIPMPENPRTSLLALQSLKALLRKMASPVHIGT